MKTFAIASFIALASVASAQLDNIPQCALSCLLTPLSNDGCPALDDFKCHCEKADSLFSSAIPCVQKACEAADQQKTIEAVEGTCKQAGVPIQVPVIGSSSAAGTPTPTPTPSATPSATPEESSTPTPSATPSETPEQSSAASSALVTATPSGNGTVPSSTPSATVSEFTGAAAQATQAIGVIGAAAIALLAL
ncbi:CFEM-domain-containing protein [Aaosphaeria arxii CBS 175.79]|uniref:CFEM-domain-containing protein n=1 Tax=Aaosphaeria arxii CBS 175.79 TaxID=1450172 RepID=A0A6A5Y1G4_9PLEO|nr:CFEM-domain-containing protein [Aaosphaeria arxii CBS 175.79]KAF2018660.1 CFEM-domain-containing protein [Aaosphaeria arxii CBS 175.79]